MNKNIPLWRAVKNLEDSAGNTQGTLNEIVATLIVNFGKGNKHGNPELVDGEETPFAMLIRVLEHYVKAEKSSQPKGADEGAGSAGEVLAEVIGEVLYSELTRRSAMPQYPTTQLQLILKAMQSYASQQCAEKDKEIAELKKQPEVSEVEYELVKEIIKDWYAHLPQVSEEDIEESTKEVMQAFANQKEQMVSEDRLKVLEKIAEKYAVWTMRKSRSFTDFETWKTETPEAQQLISQLFEPQPVQGESDREIKQLSNKLEFTKKWLKKALERNGLFITGLKDLRDSNFCNDLEREKYINELLEEAKKPSPPKANK
jgi:hypothetical protein